MVKKFGENISLLRMTINLLNDATNRQISHVENVTSFVLQDLKEEMSERILDATNNLQTTTNRLSEILVFQSCMYSIHV